MKTGYDLFRELLGIMTDIDAKLDEKSKAKDVTTRNRLDKDIDNLEMKMYEVKNILKSIEIR